MPTSVFSPNDKQKASPRYLNNKEFAQGILYVKNVCGFTILELMIVLFLFSVIAALSLPRLLQVHESFNNRIDQDEILIQVADIGIKVMRRGTGGKIEAVNSNKTAMTAKKSTVLSPKLPYHLPHGWKFKTKKDIVWLDNGVCLGGTLYAIKGATSLSMVLEKPFCQPQINQ